MASSVAVALPRLLQNDPDLKTLHLPNALVTDLQAEQLAKAILKNRFLKTLDLRGNRIREGGAIALAEMLLHNPTLTSLDLSHNEVGEKAGDKFVDAAQQNTTLLTLKLENSQLSGEQNELLQYWIGFNSHPSELKRVLPQVQTNQLDTIVLDLSVDTGLRVYTRDSAQLVSHALKKNTHVKKVILDRNFRGDDQCALISECLQENSSITLLSMVGCSVGFHGAQALAEALLHNSSVKTIDLADNEIGDAGVRCFLQTLQHNDRVTKINLVENTLGGVLLKKLDAALSLNAQPSSVKHILPRLIANDETLTVANLRGDRVEDGGEPINDITNYCGNASVLLLSEALHHNTNVHTLDLGYNYIGPDGIKGMAAMLRTNRSLTSINLTGNQVADEGARMLVDALQSNSSLVDLPAEGNNLSYKMQVALGNALKLNKQPTKLKETLALVYENHPDLETLSFAEMAYDEPHNGRAEALAKGKSPCLTDDSVELLCKGMAHNTVTKTLNLRGQELTDKSMVYIADMLKTNHSLTNLNLCDNRDLSEKGVTTLLAGLMVNDHVIECDLGIRHRVPEEWLSELQWAVNMNKQPRALKQAVPRLSADDPGVRVLTISGQDEAGRRANDATTPYLVSALTNNNHLTALNLSGGCISNLGAERLADYLRSNKTLWKLDVSTNDIGVDGADHLAMALRANHTLKSLDLSGNHILEEGARAVHDMLLKNHFLVELSVEDNQISASMKRAIRSVLLLNSQPGILKSTFLRALEDDKTLKVLDIPDLLSTPLGDRPPILTYADNSVTPVIDDNTVDVVVHCLRNNHHIEEVSFAKGNVSSQGCMALAPLLRANPYIKKVDLSYNQIDDKGIGPILDVLKLSNVVVGFDVSENSCSEAMQRRLRLALQLNLESRVIKQICLRLMAADSSLKYIVLSQTDGERGVDDTTCELLQTYMEQAGPNCHIESMDLNNNFIGDQGCSHLARLLDTNTTLTALSLDNNQITDEGLASLNRAMSKNLTLHTFSCEQNDVSPVLLSQVAEKALENSKRKIANAVPHRPRRRTSKPFKLEDTTDYYREMNANILADAMQDSVMMIRSR